MKHPNPHVEALLRAATSLESTCRAAMAELARASEELGRARAEAESLRDEVRALRREVVR